MVKYKIEREGGQTLLVIQGQKGQQISQREYYALNRGQIGGLLHAEVVQKSNAFKINYNISGYISLREFLFNPLNKASFAKLLNNILNNLKALQKAYFNQQYILMDMNAAMVNPATQEVSFVYVPITFFESGTNLKDFLLSIIQCCSFVPGENTDYVREYIRILNSGINFSIFDLEEYIKTLNGPVFKAESKKCTKCGAVLQPNVNFCSSCGAKLVGLNKSNIQGIYDPLQGHSAPKEQPMPAEPDVPATPALIFSETVANSCLNYNAVPMAKEQPAPAKLMLIRRKTNEQIPVSALVFRIGKDPYKMNYVIADNSAISRSHAEVKFIDNKWLIADLNSTNKTYLNDQVLYPNMGVELKNGMVIRLANEEFIVQIY